MPSRKLKAVSTRKRNYDRKPDGAVRLELDKVRSIVAREADRKIQLMAFGAANALAWVLGNPEENLAVSRLTDLTVFALKLRRKPKLRTVPTLVRRSR